MRGDFRIKMNLICNAIAFKENAMGNGTNCATEVTKLNYLKNSVVSLISAKANNLNAEVVLYTNTSIPDEFKKLFNTYDIKIIPMEFDHFSFNNDMSWSLAFYKLNVLYKLVEQGEYDNIVLIESTKTASLALNESFRELSPIENIILSLEMITMLSVYLFNSTIPNCAFLRLVSPSNLNGVVTMDITKQFLDLASFAISLEAPVPVPPPIPQVIKAISALSKI